MAEHQNAETAAREILYAIRRADGEPIGDYSFITTDGDDWSTAEDEARGADERIEFEMVRMWLEVTERRTLGPEPEPCAAWDGDELPSRSWWAIEITPDGTDEHWPVRPATLATRETEADAWLHVAELPDEFFVHPGVQVERIRKSQLTVVEHTLGGYTSSCNDCGWPKSDHAVAPTSPGAASDA